MFKPNPIPGTRRAPWWSRKGLLEAIAAGGAVGAVALAAYRLRDVDVPPLVSWAGAFLVAWAAFGGILRVWHAHRADAADQAQHEHEGLYAAMIVLQALAESSIAAEMPDDAGPLQVRATFHRVVPPLAAPEQLEQIIPYVGGPTAGVEAGRTFSVHVGITGQAVRNQTPYVMSSHAQTEQEHVAELVSDWGYTKPLADTLLPGRFSALAVPVLAASPGGQQVLGVIYLDSNLRGAFDGQALESVIIPACDAIADFATRRY